MRLMCVSKITLFFCLFSTLLSAVYAPLPPDQMASYNQAIINEVEKQENALANATQEQQSMDNFSIGESGRLSVISSMAEVKRTLANNFLNTPSLNSPLVRDLFLSIMQKDVIGKEDLEQLQALVTSEAPMTTPILPTGPSSPTMASAPVAPTAPAIGTGATVPSSTMPGL